MCDSLKLMIPDTNESIRPGNVVKFGRFDNYKWVVNYGWFEFGGNRSICGWYVTNISTGAVKPIFQTDLEDCYSIS